MTRLGSDLDDMDGLLWTDLCEKLVTPFQITDETKSVIKQQLIAVHRSNYNKAMTHMVEKTWIVLDLGCGLATTCRRQEADAACRILQASR